MKNFDIPLSGKYAFQNPASPIAEGIIDLHHSIFFYLILVLCPVIYLFIKILVTSAYAWIHPTKNDIMVAQKNYLISNGLVHGMLLEIIWTIIPSIILMLIAVPSFALLYSIDEVLDPQITIKIIGHQWFWSYESPFEDTAETYLKPLNELMTGDLRLLEVDTSIVCPTLSHIRFIITSTDVLHSYTIPALGIKVDAVPGRLNQLSTFINRPGIYYGQCSEICGVNHGFMPSRVLAIDSVF